MGDPGAVLTCSQAAGSALGVDHSAGIPDTIRERCPDRLNLDVSAPHDEAPRRIEAAPAAGGRLVSAARAPAFWVLANPEGNEACVSTWQGRDG
ncbi:VOC family protein [Streptomyces sp. NPDC059874]|uniref:VOC family protein n=1 Tax=Streptomyces sp. NPDC059874 TaxID=3346983 RepID=UPI0036635DDB